MSLRERGKQRRREAVLQAAAELLAERGFTRTTMELIAARAGLGVATVYKYFGTKASIVESIIRPSLEKAFAEAAKIIASPPADPGAAMAELIDKYRYLRDDWSDRRLLQAISVAGPYEDDTLSRLTREADERCLGQARDLLRVLKSRGDLDPRLDIDDAALIVFCVFNQHYEMFVSDESIAAEELFAALARRTRLLFRAWVRQRP